MDSERGLGVDAEQEGFEALYARLEQTLARLEEGGLTLEESLSLYEKGMKLAERCQDLLQQAELRIRRLQEDFAEGQSLREEGGGYSTGEPAAEREDAL